MPAVAIGFLMLEGDEGTGAHSLPWDGFKAAERFDTQWRCRRAAVAEMPPVPLIF